MKRVAKRSQGLLFDIAKEMVKLYEETIQVESEVGKGSKFPFTLPGSQPSAGS